MPRFKKIISGSIAVAFFCSIASTASAESPTSREYPYLYKSSRAMGMGGAYTAVGGRVDTLFYNPAGLSNIPKDKGWEVNIVNVSAEAGKNAVKFYGDLQDALDTGDLNGNGDSGDDQLIAVNDVLAKYRGENLHLRVADFTSFGKNWDRFAFGLGGLANGRVDAMSHQGLGTDGLLELNADATYGGVGGMSYGVTSNVFFGVTLKALKRESVIHQFTAREIVEKQDDLDSYITDELRARGRAVGYDAGLIWKVAEDSFLRPAVGVSALNIGDLDFGDAGKIPMSINVGLAVNPRITWFRALTVAVDYVDIRKNFIEDKDTAKRIRYGAELQLFDLMPVEMSLRAGMYEGAPTLGADMRILTFLLSYTLYSEEVGAYAGQDRDKRQLVTFNFGW